MDSMLKSQPTFKPKLQIRRALVRLKCATLFVRNLVFAKKLHVTSFSYLNNIVLQGNKIEFLWEAMGCHKVAVKDLGVFPGNSFGVQFIFRAQQNPIKITFFGVRGQKETKEIQLDATLLELSNKFIPTTTTPRLTTIPMAQQKLVSICANSFELTDKADIDINVQPYSLISSNLIIEHELFIKTNYSTKTQ